MGIKQSFDRSGKRSYNNAIIAKKKLLFTITKTITAKHDTFNINQRQSPEACSFIEKDSLAQMFSCEFCEISKHTFFTGRLRWLLLKNPDLLNGPVKKTHDLLE